MRLLPLLLFFTASLHAAVSGTVVNKTTGKPQPNAVVTIYSLGQQGMNPVKTVKTDAQGAFQIDDYTPQGPHLVQTISDGVIYNKMIQPGAPATGLQLDVYNSTAERGQAAVTQHMVLIEALGGILHISESIIFTNPGNTTYNDTTHGTLHVWLPPEKSGEPRLMVTAPQGMPVQRDLVAVGNDGTYRIDFPIKPGETRFDLTYVLPHAEPQVLNGKILHGGGPVRLVAPAGVTLLSDAIKKIGEEPQTHASVYEVSDNQYSITIEGTGSLRVPESAASSESGGGGSSIQQIDARIYSRLGLIVGLGLAILFCGFLLLYRRPYDGPRTAAPAAPRTPSSSGAPASSGKKGRRN